MSLLPDEPRLTMGQAATAWSRRLPSGQTVSPRVVAHRIRVGAQSRSGATVRLDGMRLGRRLYTTEAAIDRFERALADSDAQHFERAGPTAPRSRPSRAARLAEASLRRAEAELHRAGLLTQKKTARASNAGGGSGMDTQSRKVASARTG